MRLQRGGGEASLPLADWLDRHDMAARLAAPHAREAFFGALSYRSFERCVVGVNRAVRPAGQRYSYIPDGQRTVRYEFPQLAANDPVQRVDYLSPSEAVRVAVAPEAFEAAHKVGANEGITLLGIVYSGIHRLYDGHTRTFAAMRQLFAPEGRGYNGSAADRGYYARLIGDPALHKRQGLDPLHTGLVRDYTLTIMQYMARVAGQDKTVVGMQRTNWEQTRRALPRSWGSVVRQEVSAIINERDFGMVSVASYLRRKGLLARESFADSRRHPGCSVLALGPVLEVMRQYPPDVTFAELTDSHDAHKAHFLRHIVQCIVQGEERFFGNPKAVLDNYRLPETA